MQRFLKYSHFLRIRPTIQRYHTPVSFPLFTLIGAHSSLLKLTNKQRNLNKIAEIENNQQSIISPEIQEKEREIEFLKYKLNECKKDKQKYWRQIMKLRKKISALEDQIQEIKAENAETKTQMKSLRKCYDTIIEEKKIEDAEREKKDAEINIKIDKLLKINEENDLEKIRREVIFQFLKDVRDMMSYNEPSFAKLSYQQQQQRMIEENSFITPQQWEFIYSLKILLNQQFHPSLSKISPTYYNKIQDIQESNMSNWNNNDQQEQISQNEAIILFSFMKKVVFSKEKLIYDDLKKQYEDNKMDYQQ